MHFGKKDSVLSVLHFHFNGDQRDHTHDLRFSTVGQSQHLAALPVRHR